MLSQPIPMTSVTSFMTLAPSDRAFSVDASGNLVVRTLRVGADGTESGAKSKVYQRK